VNERHCVVLAGGLGTRVREITNDEIPKVLLPVLGKPFLYYKLLSLREMGVTTTTVLTGRLGHLVDDFIRANPIDGMHIKTVHDGPELLGTAGSIARSLNHLPTSFWVTYGDSYVMADLSAAESRVVQLRVSAVMTIYRNRDQIQPSNVSVVDGFVVRYEKGAPPGTFEWIDYGLMLLPRYSFSQIPTNSKSDLSFVLSSLLASRQLIGFETLHRFWDIGTSDALRETEAHFQSQLML